MKKKTILANSIALLLLALPSFAQMPNTTMLYEKETFIPNNKQEKICLFQVENNCFVQLENIETTNVQFYSALDGGKRLKPQNINSVNNLSTLLFASKNTPAFALNTATNGFIHYFTQKEFLLKNVNYTTINELQNIEWTAMCNANENILFEVWKSVDGQSYTLLKKVEGNKSMDWHTYTIVDENNTPSSSYKLVVKNMDNERYSSNISIQKSSKTIVYPTIATDFINIQTNATPFISYTIYTTLGEIIAKGTSCNSSVCSIPIDHFKNGNYIISLLFENKSNENYKFIKE